MTAIRSVRAEFTMYDEAKRFAEAITMACRRFHGAGTEIVRILLSYPYGPRMGLRDGRSLPAFIGQVSAGEPLTVFGDGLQTRGFCFVSDLVEGIYRLSPCSTPEPVDIGNPNEITNRQCAEKILERIGDDLTTKFKSLPKDDPKVHQPDISRAGEVLGWEPVVAFAQRSEPPIDYFCGVVAGQ